MRYHTTMTCNHTLSRLPLLRYVVFASEFNLVVSWFLIHSFTSDYLSICDTIKFSLCTAFNHLLFHVPCTLLNPSCKLPTTYSGCCTQVTFILLVFNKILFFHILALLHSKSSWLFPTQYANKYCCLCTLKNADEISCFSLSLFLPVCNLTSHPAFLPIGNANTRYLWVEFSLNK